MSRGSPKTLKSDESTTSGQSPARPVRYPCGTAINRPMSSLMAYPAQRQLRLRLVQAGSSFLRRVMTRERKGKVML